MLKGKTPLFIAVTLGLVAGLIAWSAVKKKEEDTAAAKKKSEAEAAAAVQKEEVTVAAAKWKVDAKKKEETDQV